MSYFKDGEFDCPCGCGLGLKDFRSLSIGRLKQAREIANVPFILNSAMRCRSHNNAVGGSENSAHLRGAFDIKADNSKVRFTIVKALITAGFKRIGIGKTFIHADDDYTLPDDVIWLY